MSHPSSALRVLCALVVSAAVGACNDATAPDAERTITLESVSVPAEIVSPASFDIVGVYWRGACEAVQQRVVREPAGVRVTVFQKVVVPSPDVACIAMVSRDTVVVRIDAPYALPFTVRLQRGGEADTVLVVRRRS